MSTNVILKREPVNTSRLKVAHNAFNMATMPKPKYYIEDAEVWNVSVNVTYINEALLDTGRFTDADFKEGVIKLDDLESFVTSTGLNSYELNSSDADGCHVQQCGDIPVDIYLSDNLNAAVKAYIEAGKEVIHA